MKRPTLMMSWSFWLQENYKNLKDMRKDIFSNGNNQFQHLYPELWCCRPIEALGYCVFLSHKFHKNDSRMVVRQTVVHIFTHIYQISMRHFIPYSLTPLYVMLPMYWTVTNQNCTLKSITPAALHRHYWSWEISDLFTCLIEIPQGKLFL